MADSLFFLSSRMSGKWVFRDQETHIVSILLLIKSRGNGGLDLGEKVYFYNSLKKRNSNILFMTLEQTKMVSF